MSSEKVAVVTGSNKGIGFAIVKQLCEQLKSGGIVYLTARDEGRGQAAVKELEKFGLFPKFHVLDVENLESIAKFRDDMKNSHGGIDILVNNAGISFKPNDPRPFGEQAEKVVYVNYISIVNICRELFPLLRKGARVVNVSSCVGHLTWISGQEPQAAALRAQFSSPSLTLEQLHQLMNLYVNAANYGNHVDEGWPDSTVCSSHYTVSKVLVCALTRIQQKEFDANRPGDDIVVNSVHPGWVATDLTSHKGPMTIEQGAVAPVWCALLPQGANTSRGEFIWRDKRIIDWLGEYPGGY